MNLPIQGVFHLTAYVPERSFHEGDWVVAWDGTVGRVEVKKDSLYQIRLVSQWNEKSLPWRTESDWMKLHLHGFRIESPEPEPVQRPLF